MYAVIDFKGHQWIVKKWDQIEVDRLKEKEWELIEVKEVLAVFDENWKEVQIWKPYLEKSVKLKVKEHFLWPKIHIKKFKNKIRADRNSKGKWFRTHKTLIEIEDIV